MTSPRALVILRIGADHRVSGWARTPRAARDWELILSPYQEVPDLDAFEPDAVIPREGGKWDALHAILTERPELLTRAPRIWLPDDDIEADAATVARLLDIAEAEDLALPHTGDGEAVGADDADAHGVDASQRCRRPAGGAGQRASWAGGGATASETA